MATRLKRLDIQGFKSFATPTSFVFDTGITAVIGPNGSGKSNISDGLRWVLGEQSYSNLRGRRTEDIIFAGSSARSPLGMAEVTVTLDNEDGSLPIAFSEVSITRRAYRSGENQYLINGARVRLKDVLQVTASLGQSYTVIGQGLVDAVLSQKVDERRGLFEHAAGITGLRLKHVEAARNLTESQANCARLEDLLADLEPRLRSLERAARQAREYDDVRRQLREALTGYYRFHWRQSEQRLRGVTRAHEEAAITLEAALKTRDSRSSALALARDAVRDRAGALERARADIDELRAEQQRLDHDLALIEERRVAARNRRDDAVRTVQSFHTSRVELAQERDTLAAALNALRGETSDREREVAELEARNAASRRERAWLEQKLAEVERARLALERQILTRENRDALLRAQIEQLTNEQARGESETTARAARDAELREQQQATQSAQAGLAERLSDLGQQQTALAAELASSTRKRQALQGWVGEIERKLVATSTRLETLKRLDESGVGLYAGVKYVLDAVRHDTLSGVLGTFSSLLIVPDELEAALEAALGGHLQDLVVERWSDAEQAIDYLKERNAGRATFQPLDTVISRGKRATVPPQAGIRGLAADLIDYDGRIQTIVDSLLGRTLVAERLDAARAALPNLSPGWSVVTLGGEIVRAGGTVTGGSRIRESGALARARELRDLPREQTRLTTERDRVSAEIQTFDAGLHELTERKAQLDAAIEAARSEGRQLQVTAEQVGRGLNDLRRAAAIERERVAGLEQKRAGVERERAGLANAHADDNNALQALDAERERLSTALAAARDDVDVEALQAARSELARLRERERSVNEQEQRLETRVRGLAQQFEAAERRVREMDSDIARLEDAHASSTIEREQLTSAFEARRGGFAALQASHEAALAKARDVEQASERDAIACRDLEREHDRLTLDVARRRDERDLLLERATRDLETDSVATLLDAEAPDAEVDLARLERDITRHRDRLRRIGVAGEDAIEQYERENERISFLRQQLHDVQAATSALRTLMGELDRTMASAFDQTFGEVARAFEATFTALFGGGRARLVRCDDGDGAAGVDIVAQPPGKRLQSLGLLSGGERALTAVALLFAILKVNPSPFCLLDEVDAALDEANVVRLGNELKLLADNTQFVVVTHNRATIEGADTLYGITMGADGVSRVLSLRLPSESVG
jgi:chromosome segregation protein